ncbi:ECF transporter S component [Ruminococcaceae bacterium OttesenSCG-928-D13]|nr:ECF transporter S component [Ruminococcaceae bacterium OttesenSCG-928-D13]
MQKTASSSTRVRRMVTMAMLAALAVVLVWLVHFPLIPSAPFLEYDPATVPMLVGAFALGPIPGLVITVVAALVQGLTVSAQSGPYGIIMHIAAAGTYVLVAGLIYRKNKTRKRAAVAIACGAAASVLVMAGANLVITPLFMSTTVDAVLVMLPGILLFNLIKAVINGAVTFIIYKPLSNIINR